MQTADPKELIGLLKRFYSDPAADASLRTSARVTAKQYAWPEIIEQGLLPRVSLLQVGTIHES